MTNGESAPSPGAPPDEDRRKSPRFPADMAVSVSTSDETIEGRVKDICRDAFLMEGERSFRRDTAVSFVLRLPDAASPLAARGKVVRLGPTQQGVMAVTFESLDAATIERLDAFLGKLKPGTKPPPTSAT
jgi:hypothetical protein